jgi:hypothetical protein
MDRSRVRKIVEKRLPAMQERFGLGRWKVRLEFVPREGHGDSADVSRNTSYNLATIGFDPELQEDEAQVVRDLRHELIHLVLGPIDVLWAQLTVGLEGDRLEAATRAWRYAIEQTVLNVEALLDNIEAAGRKRKGE